MLRYILAALFALCLTPHQAFAQISSGGGSGSGGGAGDASAANQVTANTKLDTIITNTGGPVPAGTNQIGSVVLSGATTGGNTPYSLIAAATTNSTSVKGSAGTLYGISLYSGSSTAVAYLKIYDTASAPTCGSGTPKERHLISYGASGAGGGAVIPSDLGVAYASGIGICITGGIADNDTTSVAASTFLINLRYK